jgi:hypothetical protein
MIILHVRVGRGLIDQGRLGMILDLHSARRNAPSSGALAMAIPDGCH